MLCQALESSIYYLVLMIVSNHFILITPFELAFFINSLSQIEMITLSLVCNTIVRRDGGKCLSKCAQTAKRCA